MVGDEVAQRFVDEREARVGNDGDEEREERRQRRGRRDNVFAPSRGSGSRQAWTGVMNLPTELRAGTRSLRGLRMGTAMVWGLRSLPMKVTGVQHVAFVVTDVDRAVRFYTEVLGCEVWPSGPTSACPGHGPGGRPAGAPRPSPEAPPDTLQHFALEVDDLDGPSSRSGPRGGRSTRAPDPGAGHQAFLRDPSGNLIELNQPE